MHHLYTDPTTHELLVASEHKKPVKDIPGTADALERLRNAWGRDRSLAQPDVEALKRQSQEWVRQEEERAAQGPTEEATEELDEASDADQPTFVRISGANKRELQESGWLRDLLPNVRARRAFMKWPERNHKTGEAHIHLSPGSNEAVVALGEFLAQEPQWQQGLTRALTPR